MMAEVKKNPAALVILFLSSALFLFGCAAPVSERRDNILSRAAVSSNLGAEAFAGGDYRRALERFTESLRINRSLDNRPGELLDLINIGRVFIAAGNYDDALNYLNKAAQMAENMKDDSKLSEARATIAKAFLLRGDLSAANDEIERSLAIDARLGSKSGARLNIKGLIYLKSGKVSDARAVLTEALDQNKKEDNPVEVANSYRALAKALRLQGKEDAMSFYVSAYELDKSAGDPRKIALDLAGMADVRIQDRRFADAVFYLERSYIVSLNGGYPGEAVRSLDKLISSYREMGNQDKALFYEKVKEVIQRGAQDRGARE